MAKKVTDVYPSPDKKWLFIEIDIDGEKHLFEGDTLTISRNPEDYIENLMNSIEREKERNAELEKIDVNRLIKRILEAVAKRPKAPATMPP